MAFTTGAHAAGYQLEEVDAGLQDFASQSPKVSIYSMSGINPDTSLHALTNPTLGGGINTFTAPAGATLDANTTYAVFFEQTGGTGSYGVEKTESGAEDADGASGWGIGDSGRGRNVVPATPSWVRVTGALRIAVKGRAKDTTAPAFHSATVDGTALKVVFDEDLVAAPKPAPGDFHVTVGSARRTVADGGVAIAGGTVTLTLSSAVVADGIDNDTVKVRYTKPSSNALRDGFGNEVATFADQDVLNATGAVKLVSNIKQTSIDARDFTTDSAAQFTTGSNVAGYELTKAMFLVRQTSTAAPTYTVSVHSDSSGAPGTNLGTLTNPPSLPRAQP